MKKKVGRKLTGTKGVKVNMYIPKNRAWCYDADYLHKLSKDELDYYNKACSELYSNDHHKADSLHRELPNYETEVKKQMFLATNAANRDVASIVGGHLLDINEPTFNEDEIITKEYNLAKKLNTKDLTHLIEEATLGAVDMIMDTANANEVETILRSYIKEVVTLIELNKRNRNK
jgi:hypothetical protein